MNNWKRLKAILLVVALVAAIGHRAVPHIHHAAGFGDISEAPGESHSHDTQSDEHTDEHSHDGQEQGTVLASLIEAHTHTFHLHDYAYRLVPSRPLLQSPIACITSALDRSGLLVHDDDGHTFALISERVSAPPFLTSCSLRAPPIHG